MQQTLVFVVLAVTLALFMWGRFRYEAVALAALLVLVLTGVVPPGDAFLGFGHPAVITVAAVLVITRGMANAGVADWLAAPLTRVGNNVLLQVTALSAVVTVLSAFINNVGALALLMPVAIRIARRHQLPISLLLMPMAFASLLGGLITVIGTPPNLIVAAFRARESGVPFGMFDFAAVGLPIAAIGVLFMSLLGWRLLPRRNGGTEGELTFTLPGYMTEIRVPENSKHAGLSLGDIEEKLGDEISVFGLVRGDRRIAGRFRNEPIRGGDVLIVHGKAESLKTAVTNLGFTLAGRGESTEQMLKSTDLYIAEVVVLNDAWASGKTARSMNLRRRYGMNLLAVSRQGRPLTDSLSNVRWKSGDVLLIEGDRLQLQEDLTELGCLPLAARDHQLGRPRQLLMGVLLLAGTVAIAAVGWVPIQIGFIGCVLAMAIAGMFSAREAYRALDWPVLILLAAMVPIGAAMESSGGAAWIAHKMGALSAGSAPVVGLALVLVTTMCLSDIINNAAAAILMCPIATGVAAGLGVATDPFLMAVAIGASCAFLTPVGHQSNTLVMGPGGYRFSDYWRVGLPLEILIGIVAIWMIPKAWPF